MVQPNSAIACWNAPTQVCHSRSSAAPGTSTPMRRILSPCCARTASGHAAAPPRAAMNSRRLMAACSFDHLVGAGQQRGRDFKAERLGGPEVDHKLDLGALLDWQTGRPFSLENATAID